MILFGVGLFAMSLIGCAKEAPQKPERTILITIDGMTSGIHERIEMPSFSTLMQEGVLYKEIYLPLAAHPQQSENYPWSCSIPNPVLMSGTIFIGQENVAQNLIQHSFTERPTAFTVNSGSYVAIKDGFTIYEQVRKGEMTPVYTDELSMDAMKAIIKKDNPEFMRIHCQGLGSSGSRTQAPDQPFTNNIWHPESPWRLQAKHTDKVLGEFVQWLKDEGLWESTVLIVMGDHGQADGGWHEPYLPGSNTTQMVVAGKGIRKGVTYDYAEIIDVVPTIAWLQEVPAPKYSTGRVLKEIKEGENPPAEQPMRMKKLDKALLWYHNTGNDKVDPELSIDMIARWHEGPAGADYPAFVERQVAKIKE